MSDSANPHVLVEVCVESVTGAYAAVVGGAERLELCSSLAEGGLTPSTGLCQAVCAAVQVPVFAMVRPRAGDFLYDGTEVDVMVRDIEALRDAGATGIVIGALTADGQVDHRRMKEFVDHADGLPVTFHRAFDVCRDADEALDVLCELGVTRLLTSGQKATAPDGKREIRAAVERVGDRLTVMAGAGVREDNVARLVEFTGVREVHLSAAGTRKSRMAFRRDGVSMGAATQDQFHVRTTEEALVARVVSALRNR
ncbi:MAG: copper homeostasis protein CutC [Planctomycetes bacterium]|nr:copper homeostasis protein CutC [Planctomycetota bacterium]